MTVEGLASRTDLNGRAGTVRALHEPSGRWIVEVDGESVRVRAQNLRVQQDGPPHTAGYIEEYVWVQVQE